MRVLSLGSCRIHEPLLAVDDDGEIEYLNRRFKRNRPVYTHDIHEVLQLVRLIRGEIDMPRNIRLFAYERGLRMDKGMIEGLQRADCVVVELCTDKHYEAGGWTFNVNELHRRLVMHGGESGEKWWNAIERRQRPTDELALEVETALRTRWWKNWRFGDGHRLVLRELEFRYIAASEMAKGLKDLHALLEVPVLVMPHVAVRLPDGNYLAERLQHVEKALDACQVAGLPALDPRTFVIRDGQSRALGGGGLDYHHYAPDYMPIVGREIVRALRDS